MELKQLLAPKPIEQPKLMSIIEDGQGNVQINFEPRKEHPRRSYSASSSNSFLEIRTRSRRSNVHSNMEEVDYSSTISDFRYSRLEQSLQTSPDRSPTYSQMMLPNDEPAQLMMMTAEFEIDKEYLRTKAKSTKHVEKAKWFFSTLTNEQKDNFKKQWYQTMETMEMNIPMFTYFDIYATNNNIDYPFAEINMFQKDRNTTTEKKIVSTHHPPIKEIKIEVQGSEVIASPFKKLNPKEDENRHSNLKDIKGLQQQNNFTNHILGTISSKLYRIENNIHRLKETEKEKPLFRTLEYNKPLRLGNKNNDLIKALTQRLGTLNITDPSTSKINFLSGSETESSVSEEQNQNSNQEDDQINRIKYQQKQEIIIQGQLLQIFNMRKDFLKGPCIMMIIFMNGTLVNFLNMRSSML